MYDTNGNLSEGRNKDSVTILVSSRETWVSLGWVLLFKLILATEEVVHPMACTFRKVHTNYVDVQMRGSDFSPA